MSEIQVSERQRTRNGTCRPQLAYREPLMGLRKPEDVPLFSFFSDVPDDSNSLSPSLGLRLNALSPLSLHSPRGRPSPSRACLRTSLLLLLLLLLLPLIPRQPPPPRRRRMRGRRSALPTAEVPPPPPPPPLLLLFLERRQGPTTIPATASWSTPSARPSTRSVS